MAVYTFRCEEYAAIERGRETQAVHRFGELPAQHTVSPLTSPRRAIAR